MTRKILIEYTIYVFKRINRLFILRPDHITEQVFFTITALALQARAIGKAIKYQGGEPPHKNRISAVWARTSPNKSQAPRRTSHPGFPAAVFVNLVYTRRRLQSEREKHVLARVKHIVVCPPPSSSLRM